MTEHELIAHPGLAPLPAVHAVAGRVEVARGVLRFEYRLSGELALLALPPRAAPPQRTDRLWEHTCFEAFVAMGAGTRYSELNFSPSTHWAAYGFDAYRQGMQPLPFTAPPAVAVATSAGTLTVTGSVEVAALAAAPWPWRVGLTAVVEDRAGRLGYYALRHPRAAPDFHDAAGFAVLLDGSAR